MLQLSWGKLRREPATRWFDWSFAPIPKFEHRFARQNAFGPPPEFPLASSYSGIVHHLSGPSIHALSQAKSIFFFFFFSSESKKKKKKKQEAGWMMMHFSLSIDFFLKLCIVLTLVNNPEILRLFHICFRCARGLSTRSTCVYVGLLGPCFKTGRIKPFRPLLRNSNLSSFLFYIF